MIVFHAEISSRAVMVMVMVMVMVVVEVVGDVVVVHW
jgi:hypothetical protein